MAELNLKQFQAWVAELDKYLGHYDAAKVFNSFRADLAQSVEENFRGQHTPDGIPWLPRQRRYLHPPLRKTGNLHLLAVETAYHATITKDALEIDTDLLPDYGIYHLFGTRKMPAREFIGIPDEMIDRIEQAIADDVVQKMKLP